eukprot:8017246-Pyramimonas_sp.AAC.1
MTPEGRATTTEPPTNATRAHPGTPAGPRGVAAGPAECHPWLMGANVPPKGPHHRCLKKAARQPQQGSTRTQNGH